MQKKNRFFLVLRSAFLVSVLSVPVVSVQAQMAETTSKPLMVIRFNQPHVYYDQQLYGAISQAVAAKPQVMFDIISNAPVTGDAQKDARWVAVASHNTQAVVTSLRTMGVPMERMRVIGQTHSGLHYDETQIFVR